MLLNWGAGEDSSDALDSKEMKPVNPKGNQPWIFTQNDWYLKSNTLATWCKKKQLIREDPDAGKGWRQKEKGMAENEMVDIITNSMGMNLSKLRKKMKDREAWHAAVHGVAKGQTWLSNWTTNSYSPTSLNKCFALWLTPTMPHSVCSEHCQ